MELSTRARRRLATVLALVLAVESVSAVSVAATSVTDPLPADTTPAAAAHVAFLTGMPARPRNQLVADVLEAARVARSIAPAQPSALADVPDVAPAASVAAEVPAQRPERRAQPEGLPSAIAAPVVKEAPAPASRPAGHGSAPARASRPAAKVAASYQGTNHVWIPTLGINRSVRWFPCSRTREPDNYMYRWGCAGANNVYLLGHAWGVMKPLHDAYVSGRLKVGMRAWYADGNGRVRVYAVRWWKLTRPTTDAAWAWAAQSNPSMTLQTCVGRNSEYRLMVRLAEVGD